MRAMETYTRRDLLGLGGNLLAAQALSSCAMRDSKPLVGRRFPLHSMPRDLRWRASLRARRSVKSRTWLVEQGRAVLLLHGFPLNSFQWRGVIDRLAPHAHCIAPDFLGMGHTRTTADQDVGPDSQVSMLVSLLDALGVRAVDVIANDSGSAVAQLFAVRHPMRVRSLLLTNGDTEMQSPPAAMLPVIDLARQGRFVDEWLAPWHADHTLARSKDGIGGLCYANPAHPTDEALEMYFGPLMNSAERKAALHRYAVCARAQRVARHPARATANAARRYVSSGAWTTRSSMRPTRITCIAALATRAASAGLPTQSCSGPKSVRTSSPRRRGSSGNRAPHTAEGLAYTRRPCASRLFLLLLVGAVANAAPAGKPAPVIFDTDIGTDIDDAYALIALIRRPELELLGVTTVSERCGGAGAARRQTTAGCRTRNGRACRCMPASPPPRST